MIWSWRLLIAGSLIFQNDILNMKVSKLIFGLFFYYSTLQISFSRENSPDPLNPVKKSFSFGVVADIQYADAEKKGKRDYRNTLSKLEAGVNEFNSHNL
jgi:hypothetical protein